MYVLLLHILYISVIAHVSAFRIVMGLVFQNTPNPKYNLELSQTLKFSLSMVLLFMCWLFTVYLTVCVYWLY